MTTTTEAGMLLAEKAAGLSEAKKRLILSLSAEWSHSLQATDDELTETSGVMTKFGWTPTARLTPLGLALRRHLKENGK